MDRPIHKFKAGEKVRFKSEKELLTYKNVQHGYPRSRIELLAGEKVTILSEREEYHDGLTAMYRIKEHTANYFYEFMFEDKEDLFSTSLYEVKDEQRKV